MITHKQLIKLQRQLKSLRENKSNISCTDMVKFAEKCGRYPRKGGRGKEPTYISEWLEGAKPLSIPLHTGKTKTLKVGTAGNILDILEADLFKLEEILNDEAGGNNE